MNKLNKRFKIEKKKLGVVITSLDGTEEYELDDGDIVEIRSTFPKIKKY